MSNVQSGGDVSASESVPTEIPGQQTIDEASGSATELLQDGDGPTPEADAESDDEDPAEPVTEGGETAVAEPDPTEGASTAPSTSETGGATTNPDDAGRVDGDSPDEHRFRVVHEIGTPHLPYPHSVTTSAPMLASDVFHFLNELFQRHSL